MCVLNTLDNNVRFIHNNINSHQTTQTKQINVKDYDYVNLYTSGVAVERYDWSLSQLLNGT